MGNQNIELTEGAILESKVLPISELVPNKGQIPEVPKNPRFIRDKRFKDLVKSVRDDPEMLSVNEIKVYPFNGKYVIIGDNMRYRALKELGKTETVCKIIPATATAKQLRAYIQKDNIAFGEYDIDALANEWDAEELVDWGLDILDLKKSTTTEEDEAEEDNYDVDGNVPDEPKSKEGDIYQLGAHLLICGDSTKRETIDALFADGSKADLLLTDPPYNVNYGAKNRMLKEASAVSKRNIENDNMAENQFLQFLTDSLSVATANIKQGGAFYIFHSDSHGITFRQAVQTAGLELKQVLQWVKNSFVLGRQDYQWQHEPCLYGWKQGAAHYFIDRRSERTVEEQEAVDIDKLTKEQMRVLLKKIYSLPTTVIHEDRPLRSELHPTMKPVRLVGKFIKNSTRRGEVVLDPFGGSGSTLIAAEQLGRCCRMAEYDPRYIDVIIARWEEMTGDKAKFITNIKET